MIDSGLRKAAMDGLAALEAIIAVTDVAVVMLTDGDVDVLSAADNLRSALFEDGVKGDHPSPGETVSGNRSS